MTCGIRNKPKKADFVYKDGRYWVSELIRHLDWMDGEYYKWDESIIRDFVTDEIVDEDKFTDEELEDFYTISRIAEKRAFPYTYGDYDNEL